MTPALPFTTLAQASAAVESGHISPVELTQICLERIEGLNPRLNAFITLAADSALAQARAATAEIAHGRYRGPLHGIPLAIKDLYDVRGMPTTAGSPILKDNVAHEDSFAIQRLRAAGAIFLGKLNMHEWALGVTSVNPHFGACHNPWNTAYITGGSSGGSAAALAAGLCYGSLGSDTGGSIRIPASLCGVVGLKPTYGRVSVRGVVPLAWSIDHAGTMANTVEDVALLLEAIDRYDAADPYSVAHKKFRLQNSAFDNRNSEFRLGIPDASFFVDLHPETELVVKTAIKTFGELGFHIVDVTLPGSDVAEKASSKILLAEAAAYHHEHIEQCAGQIGEDVLTRFRWGLDVTGVEYALARRTQVEWRHKLERLFESIDALVLPATPMPATLIDDSDPLLLSRSNLTRFTRIFNLTGHPALVLPCGKTDNGLPIGLQLVGPLWQEAKLLQVAYDYEGARGGFRLPDF